MYQVETVYLEFLDKISNMLYGNFNQSYFGVEKARMFLIFWECKTFLKVSHFAYAVTTKHINFWKYLKLKIDHCNLITILVQNINMFNVGEMNIS